MGGGPSKANCEVKEYLIQKWNCCNMSTIVYPQKLPKISV